MTPQELQSYIDLLSTPTIGVILVVILILYREAVIHLLKTIIDVIASWVKR